MPEMIGRQVKPIPGWAMFAFGVGMALTVSEMLYVAFSLFGVWGVIGFLACSLVASMALSCIVVAEDPKAP